LYQGETDLQVAAKAFQALTCGLTPIVCLGETRAQRQAGHTETVVTAQLQTVLDRLVPAGFAGSFWLAYEPIWAIGTGLSATADQAQGVHATLRACLARYGVAHTPILYGGSVGPHNAQELFCQEDIDGGLVGSASLKTEDFLPILTALQSVISKRI
jgi:triosephosphate isomerase